MASYRVSKNEKVSGNNIFKEKMEIIKVTYLIVDVKNPLGSFNSQLDLVEEKNSEVEEAHESLECI